MHIYNAKSIRFHVDAVAAPPTPPLKFNCCWCCIDHVVVLIGPSAFEIIQKNVKKLITPLPNIF